MARENEKTFWVCILTTPSGTLNVEVTSDLEQRMAERRAEHGPEATTTAHDADRLVYAEPYATAPEALHRAQLLKGWRCEKKAALISTDNPAWQLRAAA